MADDKKKYLRCPDSKQADWRKIAHEFISAANFAKGYCHLKLRAPDGRYVNFGIIYSYDVCKIYLLDENGTITDKTQEWNSVDEMLEAGWDID